MLNGITEFDIQKIVSDYENDIFLQSREYKYGSGIKLEVYPSADVQNPNYTCEIWIAVERE